MAKQQAEETIERVLLGPSGLLMVGIRLRFMDKYHAKPLVNMEGYNLFLEPHDCDAWAIDDQSGHWLVIASEHMTEVENLGAL